MILVQVQVMERRFDDLVTKNISEDASFVSDTETIRLNVKTASKCIPIEQSLGSGGCGKELRAYMGVFSSLESSNPPHRVCM